MTYYLIPLIFLSIFTFLENSKKLVNVINTKFFYYIVGLFFIFFIGLRYKIGCDWESYITLIDKLLSLNILEILKYNLTGYSQYEDAPNHYFVIQELGHVFLSIISKNIYILNLVYATIFVIPLFYFCWNLKRTYLTLLISYPYYMIVVGMGPIRQAACISLVMISIIFISKKKYFSHSIATAFSLFIHQYSIIFNGIIFTPSLINLVREKISKKNIFLLIIIFSIILYNLPSYIAKSYFYLLDPIYGSKAISIGSIAISCSSTKYCNRSILLNNKGIIVHRYDKNHLFDIDLGVLHRRASRRRWETILNQAGLEHRGFHTLRHTHASNLISKNVNMKYISERLGHSSIIVTMDIYGHCFQNDSREQIENALNALEK